MTERDLLEAVVNAAREAYTHPGVTQSITGPTDAELEWAAGVVRRVRQHDAAGRTALQLAAALAERA